MNSCSFSSVCDAYDGGIVHYLNNPYASLTASNTSFIGCCRTRNVKCEGNAEVPLKPGRQNTTENGANSFIWCEWNGSKTTGTENSYSDGMSSGGAICMFSQSSASVSVSHCTFSNCYAHYAGGGINCYNIKSVEIVNNTFDSCTAQSYRGGGMFILTISSCVRISGCEFQICKAYSNGGGLYLDNFQVSGSFCIGTENEGGESACVFECLFTSCSLTNSYGGGMYCRAVPAAFKMRSLQFISCSAVSYGGGFRFYPNQQIAPSNNLYCYFFFFHDCSCTNSTPYGHDVYFRDDYNLFSSNNPFYESYTTNTNENRICHAYSQSNNWYYKHTEKKDWVKEGMKDRYVGVDGSDANNLCGMSEAAPCKTVGHAVGSSMAQLSSTITLLDGRHVSEGAKISVGKRR
ncbi:uncharacterized protein MONOS_11206 [Monocercomonoides exilis]|uniref:uncharacterized protein n=1 Tax=Monocercomonoides exilis TaxID=2049356 RepID=UPI00355A3B93|nr:hypothetical protein MONOS_11206 [Monocercomonoides exilis]|eukprot:MONOS_11206.1-p1 / transcript=MONOS_11206.1 / gene=MONOS_11206 / organism=Monocercomonoides_exilis_PA203 / gene_product=unspecified product / transcript_product=unspecified product / location=Mono_scaffold00550:18090-19301(+) / protein_length=404 / sequence_SO=supercontig / SO=protein_coding / is_pseudo=false